MIRAGARRKCVSILNLGFRYGGEEFSVIASGADPAMLPVLGEKILRTFRSFAKPHTPSVIYPFAISIGLATGIPEKNAPFFKEKLLEAADKALYAAKDGGRDRFEVSTATQVAP